MDQSNINLSCSICMEIYDSEVHSPRILRCGHTYCSICLYDIINAHEEEPPMCPNCRRNINETLSSLPVNFSALTMADEARPNTENETTCNGEGPYTAGPCFSHGGAPKKFWCKNCHVWVCENCKTDIHKSLPQGKCHVLTERAASLCLKEIAQDNNQALNYEFNKLERRIIETKAKVNRTKLDIQFRGTLIQSDSNNMAQKIEYFDETLTDMNALKINLRSELTTVDEASTTGAVVKCFQKYQLKVNKAKTWLNGNNNMYLHGIQTSILRVLPSLTTLYAVKEVGSKTKWAQVTIEGQDLLIHSLQNIEPEFGSNFVLYTDLWKPKIATQVTVALDINWDQTYKGRVIITLNKEDDDFSKNFRMLVSGEARGKLKNSKNLNSGSNYFTCGDYAKNDGTGGRILLDEINQDSCPLSQPVMGSVYALHPEDTDKMSQFAVVTSPPPARQVQCFGKVTSGLGVLIEAQENAPTTTIIQNCGILVTISSVIKPW